MSAGAKVAIGISVGFVTLLIVIGAYFFTARYTANSFEQGIIFQGKNMQNIHSQAQKIVKTSGLTVKNFSETKIKAINAKVAQYADKPQMMMMWIKENPQQIESKIWEKFSDQMEKQYTYVANEQKMIFSKSQAYKEWLFTLHGTASGAFNYPSKEVVALMDRVIQTQETKETFETGIDKAVEVF